MNEIPQCPKCGSRWHYPDGDGGLVCGMCGKPILPIFEKRIFEKRLSKGVIDYIFFCCTGKMPSAFAMHDWITREEIIKAFAPVRGREE